MTDAPERAAVISSVDEAGAEAGQRRRIRAWAIALILLCTCALSLEFWHIQRTLPYPRHVDEGFVAGPAQRTIETGDLHPYRFNYPSLPKYLAAAGMAAGFLRAAKQLEVQDVRRVGSMGYPYYDTPIVMQTARQLFAVLSIIAAAATGLAAWLALRRPAMIFLAPLFLLASPLFVFHSWTYLNVDIVGTCFVALTVAACLHAMRRPSLLHSGIVPGVCAGLAAGSKYTLALVILPVLLGIGLSGPRGRKAWTSAAAIGAMVAAFVAVVPYCLIDIPGFLNGVAWEAFHYASGHRGFNAEPGLSQLLFYARHFASEFGIGGLFVAVLGISTFAVIDWRRALVLIAFPVALLWLLSSQRTHFTRNVLSLHPLVATYAAVGLLSLHGWMLRLARRRRWVREPGTRPAAVLAVVLVVGLLPWWHFADYLRDRTDSRNQAVAWIEERLPRDWTIVIPKQLGVDARRLQSTGRRVVVVDLQSARDAGAIDALFVNVPSPAVMMVPRWGADQRYPGGEPAVLLNELARRWHAIRTFGTNPVLVNYSSSAPWGDPAFAIASLR